MARKLRLAPRRLRRCSWEEQETVSRQVLTLSLLVPAILALTPALHAVTWVKGNGASNVTVAYGQNLEITMDCTPGGEVMQAQIIWDKNANGTYEPDIDRVLDGAGSIFVDNSWTDENPALGLIKHTEHATFGEMIGQRMIYRVHEVANNTTAQCTVLFVASSTTYPQGVTGHVENPDGSPAQGVPIYAVRPNVEIDWDDIDYAAIAWTSTNSSGNYTLYLPQEGNCGVGVFSMEDGWPCVRKVYVPANQFVNNIDFARPTQDGGCDSGDGQLLYTVSGIVTDTQDRPLPGVQVRYDSFYGQDDVYTDLTGHYSMEVPAGQRQF